MIFNKHQGDDEDHKMILDDDAKEASWSFIYAQKKHQIWNFLHGPGRQGAAKCSAEVIGVAAPRFCRSLVGKCDFDDGSAPIRIGIVVFVPTAIVWAKNENWQYKFNMVALLLRFVAGHPYIRIASVMFMLRSPETS